LVELLLDRVTFLDASTWVLGADSPCNQICAAFSHDELLSETAVIAKKGLFGCERNSVEWS
jgi:hypothetical protein